MTGPESDKKREVDLVPLDAIQVVTVQVKAAIENGCLARLWEKGCDFWSSAFVRRKGDFFQRKRMNFPKDTLIISGTSILMRACLDLPAIRYFSNDWVQTHQQFFENPSVKQNCNSCYRANCFFTKTEFQILHFRKPEPLQKCHQKCLESEGPAETLDDQEERTSTKSFQVKKLNITTRFCCLFQ